MTAPRKVILKLDDVGTRWGRVSHAWQQTFAFLDDHQVTATLGLIGKDLVKPGRAFLRWLADQEAKGHEIWNHGFSHDRPAEARPENGLQGAEFRGMPFDHQVHAIQKTQDLARDRLGLVLTTFGAPFNATDAATARALEQTPEIDAWFFKETDAPTSKHVLPRLPALDLEYPVHIPDSAQFLANLAQHPDKRLIILQGHPGSWFGEHEGFGEFKKIVAHLRNDGAEFLTPRALVAQN